MSPKLVVISQVVTLTLPLHFKTMKDSAETLNRTEVTFLALNEKPGAA